MSSPGRLARRALPAVLAAGVVSVGAPAAASGTASADDRGPGGLAVWAAFLDAADHTVERANATPAEADLDPDGTTVLIDPGPLEPADIAALRDLVADGGHLVVGGDIDEGDLAELAGSPIDVGPSALEVARPLTPAPEVSGVQEVAASGTEAITRAGAALPLLGDGTGNVLAALATPGSGRVVLLADATPLTNQRIEDADNAQFALDLAGSPDRPVRFVEPTRAEPGEGLAALPNEWLWGFGGLVLAGLCLVAARARRLGPPQEAHRALPPPRRAYVDAMAAQLARAGDREAAARAVAKLEDHNRLETEG
jgi:hypothetical protein